jgi:hypothetical protein
LILGRVNKRYDLVLDTGTGWSEGAFYAIGVTIFAYFNGKLVKRTMVDVLDILKGQGEILSRMEMTLNGVNQTLDEVNRTVLRLGEMMEWMDLRAEERYKEVLTAFSGLRG